MLASDILCRKIFSSLALSFILLSASCLKSEVKSKVGSGLDLGSSSSSSTDSTNPQPSPGSGAKGALGLVSNIKVTYPSPNLARISWSAGPDADCYLVRLKKTQATDKILEENCKGTALQVEKEVESGQSYYFWIHSAYSNFNYGDSKSFMLSHASFSFTAPGNGSPPPPASSSSSSASSSPYVPPPPTVSSCLSGSSRSITQHGITWNFPQAYECGNYINGDYWVKGPIVISSISPTPEALGRHGTVINPALGSDQGFDKDLNSSIYENKYVPALNVGSSPNLSVPVNSSVVSTVTSDHWVYYYTIQKIAILTVVSRAPEANSFRPPYIGNGSRESRFDASSINYSRLGTLPKAPLQAVLPSIHEAADMFSPPWYEQTLSWTGRYMHTINQAGSDGDGYGRNMAIRTTNALLLLNLDFTKDEKQRLLIGYLQAGIDLSGIISKGGRWYADGGHNNGRLGPVLLAAAVFNDSTMKAQIKGDMLAFQEYQQTFFVSYEDTQRSRVPVNGSTVIQYLGTDIGMAEWGIRHSYAPELDNKGMNAFTQAAYRDVAGSTLAGVAAGAKALGLRAHINWEPLFLYAERHITYEQGPNGGHFGYNPTPIFHKAFFLTYR